MLTGTVKPSAVLVADPNAGVSAAERAVPVTDAVPSAWPAFAAVTVAVAVAPAPTPVTATVAFEASTTVSAALPASAPTVHVQSPS